MLQLLLVSSGGALGAIVRYSIGNLSKIYFVNSFYATLSINIIGSFLIGYLISLGYVMLYFYLGYLRTCVLDVSHDIYCFSENYSFQTSNFTNERIIK